MVKTTASLRGDRLRKAARSAAARKGWEARRDAELDNAVELIAADAGATAGETLGGARLSKIVNVEVTTTCATIDLATGETNPPRCMDRLRRYSTVYGLTNGALRGAAYQQDGVYFGQDGVRLDPQPDPAAIAAEVTAKAEPAIHFVDTAKNVPVCDTASVGDRNRDRIAAGVRAKRDAQRAEEEAYAEAALREKTQGLVDEALIKAFVATTRASDTSCVIIDRRTAEALLRRVDP